MQNKTDKRLLEPKVIRLICSLGLSGDIATRKVACRAKVSHNSARKILATAVKLGFISAAEINALPDSQLLGMFYPDLKPSEYAIPNTVGRQNKYIPDFQSYAALMVEKRLNQDQIYAKYKNEAARTDGEPFSRSYFYRRLKEELRELTAQDDYYFAQDFAYGQYMQIDFSGAKYNLPTFNGKVKCWMCVIVWPASYYAFSYFVTSQSTAESCRAVAACIRYCKNHAPMLMCSDNAKCWVTDHRHRDALINEGFENYMFRLGICVEPAPPRRPQRKSACEYSVLLCERLMERHRSDFTTKKTLLEHSKHLMELVEEEINQGPFRKSIDKSRSYLFNTYELPASRMLTDIPQYEGEPKIMTVPRSYLLEIEGHRYSVPYIYIKKQVEVYLTNDFVIVKDQGVEIARHLRQDNDGGKTVEQKHMPEEHKQIAADAALNNAEFVLQQCKQLGDDNLYTFCLKRIEYGRQRGGGNVANAIRSCRGVVNFYNKQVHKNLVSQACKKVLQMPPRCWNTHLVQDAYIKLTNSLPPNPTPTTGKHKAEAFVDTQGNSFYKATRQSTRASAANAQDD